MQASIKTTTALLSGLLLLTGGCKRSESPPAGTTPSPQVQTQPQPAPSVPAAADLGAPSLLMWQEVKGRCEWSVLRPPALETRLVMVTYKCPGNDLVWDPRGGRALFALDRQLYLHDWKAAKVEDLGPIPAADEAEAQLGITDEGALRVCTFEEQPGKEGEGSSRVRVFTERQPDGKWAKAGEEKAGFEMEEYVPCGGPPGLQWAGTVYYDPQALAANGCTGLPNETCPSQKAIAAVQAQVIPENDGIEYRAITNERFIAYAMLVGDTSHPIAPILAIEKDAVRKVYDRKGAEQLGILLAGDYFLVRSEFELTHASLFKHGEITPLEEFPDDMRVIWIAGTLEPGKVIEILR